MKLWQINNKREHLQGPDTGPVQSMSGISGLQMDTSRSGKISSRHFAIEAKNEKSDRDRGVSSRD